MVKHCEKDKKDLLTITSSLNQRLTEQTAGLCKLDHEVSDHEKMLSEKAELEDLAEINVRMKEMPTREEVKKVGTDISDTVSDFKK